MKPQIRLFKALSTLGIWIHSTSHKIRHYGARMYVSGKITGLDEMEYTGNFMFICSRVRKMGFIAVSPLNLPKRKTWIGYMVQDLFELLLCRSVYFQDNFRDSRGAMLEYRFACLTFKKRYFERVIYKLAKPIK